MSENKKYHDKRPMERMQLPRCHWTRKRNRWKPKTPYNTEDEAYESLNQSPRLLAQGYTVYLCYECGRWHIGKEQGDEDT